jgi:PleD family two-component response regulator
MPENENSKKIICLIDNDQDDRMLLHEALLSLEGSFEIIELISAGQLLDHLEAEPLSIPDYIFLDLLMPGMNGFECLEKLRSGPLEFSKTKVIIYSFQSGSESMQRAFDLGADFYAVKPARYSSLKDLVRVIMESCWEDLQPGQRIFHAR